MQQPELGKKIAELRRARNLTQEELADKSSVSARTIQRIETGDVVPRPYSLRSVYKVLEYTDSKPAKGRNLKVMIMPVLLTVLLVILLTALTLSREEEQAPVVLEVIATGKVPAEMFHSLPLNGTVDFSFKELLEFDSAGYARVEVDIDQATFLHLFSMGEVGTFVIAEPGESYQIRLPENGSSVGIEILARNAAGQQAYNKLNNFPVPQITAQPWRDLSLKEVDKTLIDMLNAELAPFKDLLENDQISQDFFDLVALDRHILNATLRGEVSYLKFLDDYTNNNGNYTEEVEQFWEEAFDPSDVNDPSLLRSIWAHQYLKIYVYNLRYNDPEFNKDAMQAVYDDDMFHTWFLNDLENDLNPEIRQFFTGTYLYRAAFPQHFEQELLPLFETFNETFNGSIYTPFLEPVIEPIRQYNKDNEDLVVNLVGNTQKVNSLAEFIRLYRGQRLFIDVWATWCAPCKEAFAFNEDLQQILDAHRINKAYISIDRDTEEERWQKMIHFYELNGDHIRTDSIFRKDMFRQYSEHGRGIEIPWYLLVDEQGKIVVRHAAGPTDLSQLSAEIMEAFGEQAR